MKCQVCDQEIDYGCRQRDQSKLSPTALLCWVCARLWHTVQKSAAEFAAGTGDV